MERVSPACLTPFFFSAKPFRDHMLAGLLCPMCACHCFLSSLTAFPPQWRSSKGLAGLGYVIHFPIQTTWLPCILLSLLRLNFWSFTFSSSVLLTFALIEVVHPIIIAFSVSRRSSGGILAPDTRNVDDLPMNINASPSILRVYSDIPKKNDK